MKGKEGVVFMKNQINRVLKKLREHLSSMGSAAKSRVKALDAWLRRKLSSKKILARVGYYAALTAILTILGVASYAYRDQHASPLEVEPSTQPQAVAAVRTPAPTLTPTPVPTPEPVHYVWPVYGDILSDFAPDQLIWSNTLSQWQTHPAIDIAAPAGEAVVACADGTVVDAYSDSLWGNVIVIEHEDGYVSTYANLNTLNLVTEGDEVTAGQTISSIGKSASCEADQPWHLHFALKKDGQAVDFKKFMEDNRF